MRTKRAPYRVSNLKALPDDAAGEGTFEAIVSVFGTVDLVGDIVVKGAFAKSLERWKASGDPIPVYWDHDWSDPDSNIGEVLEAEERDEGLYIKAKLDIEEPRAKSVYAKLRRRRIKEFSFAYDVIAEREGKDANELTELDLLEATVTFKGAHPDTELIGVKHRSRDRRKAYVTLSGSLEERSRKLRLAVDGWVAEAFPTDDDEKGRAFGWVEATFEDTVLVTVEDYRDPENTAVKTFEIPYAFNDNDELELGEAREVELTAVVEGKSRGRKSGRVLSSKNEGKLRDARTLIDDVLASVEDVDDTGGKGAPVESSGRAAMTPDSVRLAADLLELDAVDDLRLELTATATTGGQA